MLEGDFGLYLSTSWWTDLAPQFGVFEISQKLHT